MDIEIYNKCMEATQHNWNIPTVMSHRHKQHNSIRMLCRCLPGVCTYPESSMLNSNSTIYLFFIAVLKSLNARKSVGNFPEFKFSTRPFAHDWLHFVWAVIILWLRLPVKSWVTVKYNCMFNAACAMHVVRYQMICIPSVIRKNKFPIIGIIRKEPDNSHPKGNEI